MYTLFISYELKLQHAAADVAIMAKAAALLLLLSNLFIHLAQGTKIRFVQYCT